MTLILDSEGAPVSSERAQDVTPVAEGAAPTESSGGPSATGGSELVDRAWKTAAIFLYGRMCEIANGDGGRPMSARRAVRIARATVVEFLEAVGQYGPEEA